MLHLIQEYLAQTRPHYRTTIEPKEPNDIIWLGCLRITAGDRHFTCHQSGGHAAHKGDWLITRTDQGVGYNTDKDNRPYTTTTLPDLQDPQFFPTLNKIIDHWT